MNKRKQENIVGKDIGIYKVLYECDHKSNDGHRLFHVKCTKCGFETDMQFRHILEPKICQHLDMFGHYKIYGFKWENRRIGNIFKGMKDRCYNKDDKTYRWYGAKGIKICQSWLDNPQSFEQWALSNGYADNLTIDRIDETKDYCPDNCRWVTLENNSKYKSTTYILDVDGVSHTGREWPDVLNLGTAIINTMLRKYDEELVKEFIRRRLANPNLTRHSHQTWMNVYGLE